MDKEQKLYQDKFASREVRYSLMRVLRGMGWPLWLVGMATWYVGLCEFGNWLENDNAVWRDIYQGPGLFILGIGIVVVALAITSPYQFESRSEESKFAKCKHCGKELINPTHIFPKCVSCGATITLRISVMVSRFISSQITAMNILIIVSLFAFALA